MSQIPHGYTYTEVIIAFGLVIAVVITVVAIMNPINKARIARDDVRTEDVRNIFEALVEMQFTDSEAFAGIVGTVAGGRTMVGTASICAGEYGPQCSNGTLQDHCVNLAELGVLDYVKTLPVDQKKDFSKKYSGYYLELKEQILSVGACNPEARDEIKLELNLK